MTSASGRTIPYEDLKQRTAGKVRGIQAQERYTLPKGRPETSATKNERAFVVPGPPVLRDEDPAGGSVCTNTPQKPLIP
ncbi:hypothetical protein PI124_g13720 [Phytophthora idaei]|nr:hypothetical protein PI125_g9022 [Phytophthora idaei]KAG3150069.1 hypothetical protein PI126_g11687 [Phytophthora idaei]KAG3241434.1 hypothetical protein PI124_g13720 [Phytophthora idaei]